MFRQLIAGNWKMNGRLAEARQLAESLAAAPEAREGAAEIAVCPPFTAIHAVAERLGGDSAVALGGQDCHAAAEGAHTGDVSVPIVCVGETQAERDAGRALEVLHAQLDASLPEAGPGEIVLAYEPVWAIGTGRAATADDIRSAHGALRADLAARLGNGGRKVRILYGGSVKPDNAAEILALAEVDGALVGGASLDSARFRAIARAAQA